MTEIGHISGRLSVETGQFDAAMQAASARIAEFSAEFSNIGKLAATEIAKATRAAAGAMQSLPPLPTLDALTGSAGGETNADFVSRMHGDVQDLGGAAQSATGHIDGMRLGWLKAAAAITLVAGAVRGIAELMDGKTTPALESAKKEASKLADTIGTSLHQALAPLASVVAAVLHGINALLDKMGPTGRSFVAATATATAFAGALALIGPTIVSAIKIALPMMSKLRAMIMTTLVPMLPIIAAIAALAAGAVTLTGLVGRLKSGDYAKSGEGFLDVIKRGFTDGAAIVGGEIKDAFASLGISMDDTVSSTKGGKGVGIGSQWSSAGAFEEAAAEWDASNGWDKATAAWDDAANFAQSYADMVASDTKDAIAALDAGSKLRVAQIENQAKLDEEVARARDEADNKAVSALREWAAGIGQKFLGGLNKAGQVISSTIEGARQGGPWGAVVGFIAGIAQQSQSFKDASEQLNLLLGKIVAAFEPMFQGLEPLTGALNAFIEIIVMTLEPALKIVGAVLGVFGRVVAGIGVAVGYVILGMSKLWNFILDKIEWVFKKIDKIPGINMQGAIRALGRLRVNTEGMEDSIENLGDIARGATDGIESMAEAANGAASILNAPEGFKVGLARFNATLREGQQGYAPPPADVSAVSNSQQPLVVESVTVQAQDPVQLASQLSRISEINAFNGGQQIALGGSLRRRVTP